MTTICLMPRKLGLGGPASFQTRLSEELRNNGIEVTFDTEDPAVSTILVVGGTRHLGVLYRAKRRGVRIVQRLNGMNWIHRQRRTSLKHFLRSEINNRILQTIRSQLADAIVYQSEFSRDWWHRVYGPVRVPGKVVYNGVNLSAFTPDSEIRPPNDRYRMLLVEGNLGNGYEFGVNVAVEACLSLRNRLDKPLELMVVGRVPDALKAEVAKKDLNVVWKGVVKREDVADLDRSAHVYYSADTNAACPNAVIEALACGLPVIGYDSGAIPQLVTDGAGEVVKYGGDPWKLEKPDLPPLVDAAYQVLKNNGTYRLAARQRAEAAFDIRAITKEYLQVLLGD